MDFVGVATTEVTAARTERSPAVFIFAEVVALGV